MAENSKIEWTDHTFNPWIGCMKVSPACDNCYAEALDHRWGKDRWGPHAARTMTSAENWKMPLRWDRAAEKDGAKAFVFCASMADVFDNHRSIEDSWRASLWNLIEATPNLVWLLLTKRPQNIERFIPVTWRAAPLKNVWFGTTVENQTEADRRIPDLLRAPAAKRFLSMEPLLGPVDVTAIERTREIGFMRPLDGRFNRIDWIIAGGESGNNARPTSLEWFRAIRDQCSDAGTSFFFKQWGEWSPFDPKNADIQWSTHPNGISFGDERKVYRAHWMNDGTAMVQFGKRNTGRLLDGVLHDSRPEA